MFNIGDIIELAVGQAFTDAPVLKYNTPHVVCKKPFDPGADIICVSGMNGDELGWFSQQRFKTCTPLTLLKWRNKNV